MRTESIGAVADRLDFGELLRLSRGEKRGTKRARIQILANTYEAVIGAVYLDQGYETAKEFIKSSLLTTFQEILDSGSWQDPKSTLQEKVQSINGITPKYKVIDEDGPDHDKTFTVGVFVDDKKIGEGSGPSKQAGQVAAAEAALKKIESQHAG